MHFIDSNLINTKQFQKHEHKFNYIESNKHKIIPMNINNEYHTM